MKQIYLLIALLILAACKNNTPNAFCDDTEFVGSEEQYSVRNGNLLISGDSLPHLLDLIIVGDVIVAAMENNDARLQMFSMDGKSIGKFGKTGRAENEFTSGMGFVGQPDQTYLYISDVNNGNLTILDLDSLKDYGKISTKMIIKSFPRVLNAFISGDSTLIFEHEVPGSFALTARNLNSESKLWEEVLYEPTEDPFSTYHSYMVMNDKSKKLVSAMRYANQINFLDLDSKERKTYVVKSKDVPSSEEEGHEYYCNIKANDRNVFALYMNQNAKDKYSVEKPMEIHVFDWDGNFVDKILVNEYLIRIAVDNDGNIFGKDRNGNIYKYT